MTTYNIPLKSGAVNSHQKFSMLLGKNLLTFKLNYITTQGPAWSMDVYRKGELLIAGAMLEPGAEITQGYHYDIGRILFIGDRPTIDNLGKANNLVWTDE